MGIIRPPGGYKGEDPPLIQVQGFARGQIVGGDNDRIPGDMGGKVGGVIPLEQIEEPLGNIPNIRGSGPHIGIIHGPEYIRQLFRGFHDPVFGVFLFRGDDLFNGFEITGIGEHHLVYLKNLSLFPAQLFPPPLIEKPYLLDGPLSGEPEPVHLSLYVIDGPAAHLPILSG
jgi:hypothetical protein